MSCKVVQVRTAAISVPPWTLPQAVCTLLFLIPLVGINWPRRPWPFLFYQIKMLWRISIEFIQTSGIVSHAFLFSPRKETSKNKRTPIKRKTKSNQNNSLSLPDVFTVCQQQKNWSFLVSGWLYVKVRIMKKWFLHSLSLRFQGGTVEFGEGQSRSLRSQGTSFTHFYHKYLLILQHFLCFGHFCKAWKLQH